MKTIIELCRNYGENITTGAIYVNDVYVCRSIELPWHHNAVQQSCIPEGQYAIAWRNSERLGRHIHVLDVPNRQWILIHPANDAAKELKGCIAPVLDIIDDRGIHSRMALQILLRNIMHIGIQHCSLKICSQ